MKRKKMMAAVLAALMTCSAFTPAVAVKADDDVVKLKIWVFGEGSTEECEKVSEALSEILTVADWYPLECFFRWMICIQNMHQTQLPW